VEAETITGELSSELPSKRESQPGRKVLVIGRPGPTLAFRSVSGDLRVVEPRDAGPVMDPVTATPTAAGTAVDEPLAPVVTNPTDADARRLAILRALEAGEISVTEAAERLGRLEEVLA